MGPDRPQGHAQPPGPGPRRAAPPGRGPAAHPQRHHRCENRAVTTLLAQHVRGQSLFDGSLPLGIQFTSKTGYGTCWARWDRRADDGLTPGENDPKTLEDLNVDGGAFRAVTTDWQLEVLPGKPHY